MIDYREYLKTPRKDRLEAIKSARQQEVDRKPLPIAGLTFPQQNWTDFFANELTESWFTTTVKKIRLQTYRHRSDTKPIKAVVMLMHGMTSHTNEGSYVALRLAKAGFEVVGFDQRGFGKSEGTRGFMQNFDILLKDTEYFVKIVRETYPDSKLFLLGLSLGGLASYAVSLSLKDDIAGCILMAPALRSFHGSTSMYFAKFLKFLMPRSQVPKIGRGGKHGSRNPNVSELRRSDKYRYLDKPYISTLSSTLEAIDHYSQTFESFDKPVLLIQGALDSSVDPEGTIDLYERCKSPDKKILFYSKMWHNVWQEEEIYEIMDQVVLWLHQRS